MRYPTCDSVLGETEAVYQISFGYGSSNEWHARLCRTVDTNVTVGHVCEKCLKAIEGRWPKPPSAWRLPKPCGNCDRPVINLSHRQEPEIIACSPRCRYKVHNARYRAKHARPSQAATCTVCAKAFTPKHRDALYCSPACKQRAFRRRLREG